MTSEASRDSIACRMLTQGPRFMISVVELRDEAGTLSAAQFVERHGPAALLVKPPEADFAHATVQVRLTVLSATTGTFLDDLLVMLRGFRTLEAFFLKPPQSPFTFSLGREPPGHAVVLEPPSVSKLHATLTWSDTHWRLRDEHSLNGTTVNTEPVVEREITNGDVISMGDAQLLFIDTETLHSQLLALPKTK